MPPTRLPVITIDEWDCWATHFDAIYIYRGWPHTRVHTHDQGERLAAMVTSTQYHSAKDETRDRGGGMTMSNIEDHMACWGVPAAYRLDYPWSHDPRVAEVRKAAQWYPEQDAALTAMLNAGDTAAIEEWADDFPDDDRDGVYDDDAEYVTRVRQALRDLAHKTKEKTS